MGTLTNPAANAIAVVASDTIDIPTGTVSAARALYIGGAGDVALVTENGDSVTFVGLLAGTILPVRCTRVDSTNTTATSIVAIW